MIKLSKSKFISGIQCSKKLYFDVNRKDLKPEITDAQQARFDVGHEIGRLAQAVFPNGNDATHDFNNDWGLAIKRTTEWLVAGVNIIYEASFSHSGAFAALDILHHTGGESWAIEVKSSAELKDYHFTDAAFQYWVMNQCGKAPDRFFLMHINKNYIKRGAIDPNQLFTKTDITQKIIELQNSIETELKSMQNMLMRAEEPDISIGKQCSQPFECPYKSHCWSHIPEHSVFELFHASGKDWELYEKGIIHLADIPLTQKLNKRQQLQINGIKYDQGHTDILGIGAFLSRLSYPLHFFDFETLSPAIPLLDDTHPFEKIPFQYSLHIIDAPGAEPIHREFLAHPEDFTNNTSLDPREQLLKQLVGDIEPKGSVIAYYAPFERGILNQLRKMFPQYAVFIENIIARMDDLYEPFNQGLRYEPLMGNSASIKSVLPALAPEFSYKNLEVNNGNQASTLYLQKILCNVNDDWELTRNDLLKYCERDTEGMVILHEKLWEAIQSAISKPVVQIHVI
jgi:hypothetical protein